MRGPQRAVPGAVLVVLFAAIFTLTSLFNVPTASAQGTRSCAISLGEQTNSNERNETVQQNVDALARALQSCAEATAYPGPFTNSPANPSDPYSAPRGLTATVPAATSIQSESPKAGLAHSGNEAFVLAYLGTGLLAFGAVALGLRRGARVD